MSAAPLPWYTRVGVAVDKAIAVLLPTVAAERIKARALMQFGQSFVGASFQRRSMREWFTTRAAADLDILPSLQLLRDRSRDLVRNDPLASGAIGTVCENVIGTGLSLQARPDSEALKMSDVDAEKWTANVEREFRLWAESTECDVTRTQNFYGLQDLQFRAMLEAGDAFVLLPMIPRPGTIYDTRIQLIEAERVANPRDQLLDGAELKPGVLLNGGIETNLFGEPIAYHIRKWHPYAPNGWTNSEETVVPAFGAKTGRRNVLHIFSRARIGQNRGVPYLAPVIEQLKQLSRYCEAELMAAVVSAMFTVFIKTPTGEGLISSPAASSNPDTTQEVALGNGAVVDLAAGEDVSFANPGRPNAQFEVFFSAVVRQIGVALGVPYEVLIKHFTASYSAARGALMEAWKFYKGRRAFVAASFCQPVYEAWLDEAVASGRISAPGYFAEPATRAAYVQAEWVGSSPPQIDPQKEVDAAKTRIEIGVSTLSDETMMLTGKVWEDQHDQQVKEMQRRKADGLIPDVSAALLEPLAGEPGSSQTEGGAAPPAVPAPAAPAPGKKPPAGAGPGSVKKPPAAATADDIERPDIGDEDTEHLEVT